MIINSKAPKGTTILGLPFQGLEFCNVTYMCIKEPKGLLSVPDNFKKVLQPVLVELFKHNDFDDQYLYFSLKKGHVAPYTMQMRSGFHVDGFLSEDRNWVLSDSLPTTVALGQFSVEPDHEVSLHEFNDQARLKKHEKLKPHTLYELDKECVHSTSINLSGETVVRTFLKVVASKEKFNGIGNAWNYKLPHIVPTAHRGSTRNHTVV